VKNCRLPRARRLYLPLLSLYLGSDGARYAAVASIVSAISAFLTMMAAMFID